MGKVEPGYIHTGQDYTFQDLRRVRSRPHGTDDLGFVFIGHHQRRVNAASKRLKKIHGILMNICDAASYYRRVSMISRAAPS
jgi:hypothetical protein